MIGIPPTPDDLAVADSVADAPTQTSGWRSVHTLHVADTADRYVVRTWCAKCGRDAVVDVRRVVRCPACRAGDWMAEGAWGASRAWLPPSPS